MSEVTEVFSPKQVYVGTMLGGPLAGIHFVRSNFRDLEKPAQAKTTLAVGIVFVVGIILLITVLPEDFPNLIIPLAYSGIAAFVTWHYQVSAEEAEVSEKYAFLSNWLVAKVALVSFVLFFGGVFAILLVLGVGTGAA
jgi:hypothetical protein